MAAAIVPLIAAAAPLITPLIQSLIVHVEHLFGAKTGPTKLDQVVAAVMPVVQQLATSGKLSGNLDAASVTAMVEAIVQNLKGQGILNPDTAKVIATSPISAALGNQQTATFQISSGQITLQFGS